MNLSFFKKKNFPVFQADTVPESDLLIVSFTGLVGLFDNTKRPFDFFMTTSKLNCNRIMVRDPHDLFYLRGVDETGFDGLLERLRSEIQRMKAKTLVFVGASSGGYAAVLFGHLLGADHVHAFGTRGNLKVSQILLKRDYKALLNRLPTIARLNYFLPKRHRPYLDLHPLLQHNTNPNTKINLHACAHCIDSQRAAYLKDCPGTQIFLYPCNTHKVAKVLIKSGCLHDYLAKENLDQPEVVYQKYFGDFAASRACDCAKNPAPS